MINNGLLDEINDLRFRYDNSRILNSAIGYKEFKDYLNGEESLNDAIDKVKRNSRRFAKRQYTFFKHQFNVKWFDVNFYDFNVTIDEVFNYIKDID